MSRSKKTSLGWNGCLLLAHLAGMEGRSRIWCTHGQSKQVWIGIWTRLTWALYPQVKKMMRWWRKSWGWQCSECLVLESDCSCLNRLSSSMGVNCSLLLSITHLVVPFTPSRLAHWFPVVHVLFEVIALFSRSTTSKSLLQKEGCMGGQQFEILNILKWPLFYPYIWSIICI